MTGTGADRLRLVSLTSAHIPSGLALSAGAGWNQIASDWQFMLAAGSSFGFADEADCLVASGLTVDFPDYAWISMILVTPAWRRQGLATRMMETCLGALQMRKLVPALDASPEGRQVYLRLGFRDAGTSTRLVGELRESTSQRRGHISQIVADDLPGDRRLRLACFRDRPRFPTANIWPAVFPLPAWWHVGRGRSAAS